MAACAGSASSASTAQDMRVTVSNSAAKRAWLTDETVKVCAYNFSESAFLEEKQAIIELTLRTI